MAWPRKNYKPLGDDLTAINKAALGYLSRREYSVAELTAKLRERGADESVLDESIRRLQELHYVDDSRYAAAYVRDRREFHPRGVAVIRRELAARGVDPAVAEKAIEEEYDEDTQRQTLRRLMVKAAAAMPEDEAAAAAYRRGIARRFIAKGFSQGMVFDELKDILL